MTLPVVGLRHKARQHTDNPTIAAILTGKASEWTSARRASDREAPATWVRMALFGDTVDTVAPRLTKGTEVYCEGRLNLGTWTGRDGEAKSGLNLAAWEVQPMGQIGRRKPKAVPLSRPRKEFDDELTF